MFSSLFFFRFLQLTSIIIITTTILNTISTPVSVPIWSNNSRLTTNNNGLRNNQPTIENNNTTTNSIYTRPNSDFNRLISNYRVERQQIFDEPKNSDRRNDKVTVVDEKTGRFINSKYGGVDTENRILHKFRRRRRPPCIPISFIGGNGIGTPVLKNVQTGKTINFYHTDVHLSSQANGGQYNPYGGYGCIPISYGGNQFHQPLGGGGGGGGGGLLGFFGPGGLFDLTSIIGGGGGGGGGGSGVSSLFDDSSDEYDDVAEDPIKPVAEINVQDVIQDAVR